MTKGIIKVKEWKFNDINEAAKAYHIYLRGEYVDGMLDHTTLFVEDVLAETEKAVKVLLDAETANGNPKTWNAWVPKSAIIARELAEIA